MADEPVRGWAVSVTTLTTRLLTGIGVVGLAYATAVVVFVSPGSGDSSTAPAFAVATAALGLVGVAASVWWRGSALAEPMHPTRYLPRTLLIAALAEMSLFLGSVGYLVNGDSVATVLGAVLFIMSILVLLSTVGSVEFTNVRSPLDGDVGEG